MDPAQKKAVRAYLQDETTPDDLLYRSLIRTVMASSADTCILPVQDLLGLGSDCRMNQPGTVKKNWRWRLMPGQLTDAHAKQLREMTFRYGRVNYEAENAQNRTASNLKG